MTGAVHAVNGGPNRTPKTYLTLSAVGEPAQQDHDGPTAAPDWRLTGADMLREAGSTTVLDDHGYALISVGGPVPDEAAVRDERDPYIESELELRYAWGDR